MRWQSLTVQRKNLDFRVALVTAIAVDRTPPATSVLSSSNFRGMGQLVVGSIRTIRLSEQ